ncbi:MAG TPA: response regulator [Anaeromyxobacteraceae bacterium]|nr:response regulator [Anaeromyxobacteraceae bacterium]
MAIPTGVLVVQRGVAPQATVDEAWRLSKARGVPLLSQLRAMGVDEGRLAAILAEQHEVPGVDLSRSAVDLALLDLVPRQVAEGDLILPLSTEGGRLHLATAAPFDDRVLAEVRFVTGREVSPYVAVHGALGEAVRQAYAARQRGEPVWRGAAAPRDGAPALAAVLAGPKAAPEVEELLPIEALGEGEALDIEVGGATGEVLLTVRADGRRIVLVVDDEPEIRQLVQRGLEHKGFAVETAADGEEGLRKAEALLPDLVLLDAMLPKVHGFEACRRLKASPRTRHVPVVMMTAIYRGWRFAQDAREAYGAEDYVEKPFRFDDLVPRLEAVLESTASRPRTGAAAAAPRLAEGKELLLANRLAEAQAAFEAAVQADPGSADAHALLARTLRARGDAFGALTAFERAAELRPGHLGVLRTLAALYEEKGFRRKATEALERALSAAPDEATRAALRQDLLALLG